MDAIVPPGNQNLIVDDNHTHRSHNGAQILDRVSTAAENVMNNDNSNAHDAGARAERVGFAGIDHTNQNGSEGRLITNQNGLDTRASTERNGLETRELVREEGHETRDKVDLFGLRNADAVERFGLTNLIATKDGFKDLLISTKEDLKNVLISQKDDLRDILISQKNDFKDVLLKNCQIEKDMLIQFKDAQLIAMQNEAKLAAQIAECCCEQKELTMAEGSRTRDLIRSESESRLRDDLRKTQDELLALRVRATLPPAPIASVPL